MNASPRLLLLLLVACSQPDDPDTDEPVIASPTDDTGSVTHDSGDTADTAEPPEPDPCADAAWPALAINEVVAANLSGITDEDEESSDWIELLNRDEQAVQLDGWRLQDADGNSWGLPDVELAPGALLFVWASGKESTDAALHADFKLAADDPGVWLLAPDGCAADEADPGRLYGDISYGREQDSGAFGYFMEPTPDAANTTEWRPGFAEPPVLSPDPGFYDGDVEITATSDEAGAVVYVTRNGSAPDEGSYLPTGPLVLDAVEEPIVVRARAYVDGLWPSRVTTGTYSQDPSILDDGMYVISLTVEPDDLWDEETGIYSLGTDYEPYYPYFGANFWEDWEKPLHVEIWDADGDKIVDQDGGIAIHGGYTRAFDQKSLRLYARSAYGPEVFKGQFFPNEDADEFNVLVLQLGMDWCSTHVIEPVVDELFRSEDGVRLPSIDIAAWAPAQVWLNGEYWGYYNVRERLDEEYIEHHHGEDPDELDRIELGWTSEPHWELEQGTWDEFDALNAFVAGADLSDEATWAEFDELVDLESLATAVLAEAWIGNTDWWYNNLRLWRPRREGGQWRWMVYDLGHGWTSPTYDQFATSVSWSGEGLPIADALENDAFRTLLANQASDLLNTSLKGDEAASRVDAVADRVRPAMEAQYDRWCGEPVSNWESDVAYAHTFASTRAAALRNQIKTHLGLSGEAAILLRTEPTSAGTFQLTAVEVEPPFTGTFFLGVPVTITAVPADGYVFSGWSDASLGDDPTIVVELDGPTTFTAKFDAAR